MRIFRASIRVFNQWIKRLNAQRKIATTAQEKFVCRQISASRTPLRANGCQGPACLTLQPDTSSCTEAGNTRAARNAQAFQCH